MKLEHDPLAVLTEEHSAEEQRNYTGSFCGFVLLDTAQYDLPALAARLQQRWGLAPIEAAQQSVVIEGGQEGDWLEQLLAEEPVAVLTEPEAQEGNLVFDIDGAMIAVGFEPSPVPDGEAERYAAQNQLWPDAAAAASRHVAHLMVAVLPQQMTPLEAGKVYVKILDSCLEAENAIGIYNAGTVLEPQFFRQGVAEMEQGRLPLLNWLQIGVYTTAAGSNGYTIGMDAFGKDELEILGSQQTLEAVRALLVDAAYTILEKDVIFQVGENHLELASGRRLSLRRGDGVAVDGHSMRIAEVSRAAAGNIDDSRR